MKLKVEMKYLKNKAILMKLKVVNKIMKRKLKVVNKIMKKKVLVKAINE